MKQVFYGPTVYGKSHLILHGLLLSKQTLIIITTNEIVDTKKYCGIFEKN